MKKEGTGKSMKNVCIQWYGKRPLGLKQHQTVKNQAGSLKLHESEGIRQAVRQSVENSIKYLF